MKTLSEPLRTRPLRATFENEQFAVYDDVLSQQDFEAVHNYLQVENYQWVHAQKWRKVWRLSDGSPLKGPVVYSHDVGEKAPVYPTRCALDIIIETILSSSQQLCDLVGRHGSDWTGFSASPYLYPAGSGLSWHVDSTPWCYTGAYAFFAHPRWDIQWGGELLIADESCKIEHPRDPGAHEKQSINQFIESQYVDGGYFNERVLAKGLGRFIMPKPNRLVVIAVGNLHAVRRVEPAAGDHLRQSISGFFRSSSV